VSLGSKAAGVRARAGSRCGGARRAGQSEEHECRARRRGAAGGKGRSSPRRPRSGSRSARNGVKALRETQAKRGALPPSGACVSRSALTPEHAEGRLTARWAFPAKLGCPGLPPELGYRPVNKYLPSRPGRRQAPRPPVDDRAAPSDYMSPGRALRWVDCGCSRAEALGRGVPPVNATLAREPSYARAVRG
jgi:hypothetical protein